VEIFERVGAVYVRVSHFGGYLAVLLDGECLHLLLLGGSTLLASGYVGTLDLLGASSLEKEGSAKFFQVKYLEQPSELVYGRSQARNAMTVLPLPTHSCIIKALSERQLKHAFVFLGWCLKTGVLDALQR
jgi:hypothetical protein